MEEVEVGVIIEVAGTIEVLIVGPESLNSVEHTNRDKRLVEGLFSWLMLVPEF